MVLADQDATGQRHARLVASSVSRVASDVKIIESFPGLESSEKADVSDWIMMGSSLVDLHALADRTLPWTGNYEPPNAPALLPIRKASEVESQPVRFLWPSYIVSGKLNIVMGMPGDGKTTVLIDLAARMSRGSALPDQTDNTPQGNTLYVTAEDSLADTLKPRLERQGAALDKVMFIDLVELAGDGRYLSLDDLPEIKATALYYDCKLLVIDPVFAFLGDRDAIRNTKIRQVLTAISLMAEETGIAVVGIMHPNKRSGENMAMTRISGAMDFAAAARSILVVGRDPQDHEKRVLASIKLSVGREPPAQGFVIGDDGTLMWTGPTDVNPTDLMDGESQEVSQAKAEAVDYIRDELANGPKPSGEIFAEGRAAGITEKTLRRAAKTLGINRNDGTMYRDGDGPWMWCLRSLKTEVGQPPETGEVKHQGGQHRNSRLDQSHERETQIQKLASVGGVANFSHSGSSDDGPIDEGVRV